LRHGKKTRLSNNTDTGLPLARTDREGDRETDIRRAGEGWGGRAKPCASTYSPCVSHVYEHIPHPGCHPRPRQSCKGTWVENVLDCDIGACPRDPPPRPGVRVGPVLPLRRVRRLSWVIAERLVEKVLVSGGSARGWWCVHRKPRSRYHMVPLQIM
jgi:hypothetical protein